MRAPFKKAAAVGDREGGYAESYAARGGGPPGPGSATVSDSVRQSDGLCGPVPRHSNRFTVIDPPPRCPLDDPQSRCR